ncbi:MAG: hypothetical protein WBW14_01890 [Candidatus Acidiferrum sp.]
MPKLGREIATELLGRVSEVALIHDVVAIEHRPGLVAGDIHSDPLRHASAHQIAHSSAPQIVKEQALVTPLVLLPKL